MDYDDNDSQGHKLNLAGEENSKSSPVLRPYALPKFDFDDSLPGNIRFDSLVENEVFLGISSQEDSPWIEDFSQGNSGIEFSSSATESCSISRRNNVWSEATSSESVAMLLKSVGQEERIQEETIFEESDAGNELGSLTTEMDPILKQDDKMEDVTNSQPTALPDSFPDGRNVNVLESQKDNPPVSGCSGDVLNVSNCVIVSEADVVSDKKCDDTNQLEVDNLEKSQVDNLKGFSSEIHVQNVTLWQSDIASSSELNDKNNEQRVTDACFETVDCLLRDIPQRVMEEQNIRSRESNMVNLISSETGGATCTHDVEDPHRVVSNLESLEQHKAETNIISFDLPSELQGKVTWDLQNEEVCKNDKGFAGPSQQGNVEVGGCNEGKKNCKSLKDSPRDSSVPCLDDVGLEEHTFKVVNRSAGISACTETEISIVEEKENSCGNQLDSLESRYFEVVNAKTGNSSRPEHDMAAVVDNENFENHRVVSSLKSLEQHKAESNIISYVEPSELQGKVTWDSQIEEAYKNDEGSGGLSQQANVEVGGCNEGEKICKSLQDSLCGSPVACLDDTSLEEHTFEAVNKSAWNFASTELETSIVEEKENSCGNLMDSLESQNPEILNAKTGNSSCPEHGMTSVVENAKFENHNVVSNFESLEQHKVETNIISFDEPSESQEMVTWPLQIEETSKNDKGSAEPSQQGNVEVGGCNEGEQICKSLQDSLRDSSVACLDDTGLEEHTFEVVNRSAGNSACTELETNFVKEKEKSCGNKLDSLESRNIEVVNAKTGNSSRPEHDMAAVIDSEKFENHRAVSSLKSFEQHEAESNIISYVEPSELQGKGTCDLQIEEACKNDEGSGGPSQQGNVEVGGCNEGEKICKLLQDSPCGSPVACLDDTSLEEHTFEVVNKSAWNSASTELETSFVEEKENSCGNLMDSLESQNPETLNAKTGNSSCPEHSMASVVENEKFENHHVVSDLESLEQHKAETNIISFDEPSELQEMVTWPLQIEETSKNDKGSAGPFQQGNVEVGGCNGGKQICKSLQDSLCDSSVACLDDTGLEEHIFEVVNRSAGNSACTELGTSFVKEKENSCGDQMDSLESRNVEVVIAKTGYSSCPEHDMASFVENDKFENDSVVSSLESLEQHKAETNIISYDEPSELHGKVTCDLKIEEACKNDKGSGGPFPQGNVEVGGCNEGEKICKSLEDSLCGSPVACLDDTSLEEHTFEVVNKIAGNSACTELGTSIVEEKENSCGNQMDSLESQNTEVVNAKTGNSSCPEHDMASIVENKKFVNHVGGGSFADASLVRDVDLRVAEHSKGSGIKHIGYPDLSQSCTVSGLHCEKQLSTEDLSDVKTPTVLKDDNTPEAQIFSLVRGGHVQVSKNNLSFEPECVHGFEKDVPLQERGDAKSPTASLCPDEFSKANIVHGSEFVKSASNGPGSKVVAEEMHLSSCDSPNGLPLLSGTNTTTDRVTLCKQGQKSQVTNLLGLKDLSQVPTDFEPVSLPESAQASWMEQAAGLGCPTKVEAYPVLFGSKLKLVDAIAPAACKSHEILTERNAELALRVVADAVLLSSPSVVPAESVSVSMVEPCTMIQKKDHKVIVITGTQSTRIPGTKVDSAEDNQASVVLACPSKYIAEFVNKDGDASANSVKENPYPPSVISCAKTPLNENVQQLRTKQVSISNVQHSEATSGAGGKVQSVSLHMQHDGSNKGKNTTFEDVKEYPFEESTVSPFVISCAKTPLSVNGEQLRNKRASVSTVQHSEATPVAGGKVQSVSLHMQHDSNEGNSITFEVSSSIGLCEAETIKGPKSYPSVQVKLTDVNRYPFDENPDPPSVIGCAKTPLIENGQQLRTKEALVGTVQHSEATPDAGEEVQSAELHMQHDDSIEGNNITFELGSSIGMSEAETIKCLQSYPTIHVHKKITDVEGYQFEENPGPPSIISCVKTSNPGPPSIISCVKTPQSENEQQLRTKEASVGTVQHSEATPNAGGKVQSTALHMQHDDSNEGNNITFEAGSSIAISEVETIKGLQSYPTTQVHQKLTDVTGSRSYPSVQVHKKPTGVKGHSLASDCSRVDLTMTPENFQGHGPMSGKKRAGAKGTSECTTGRGSIKSSARENAKKRGRVQETPVKQFEGDKSMMFLGSPGTSHFVQCEELKPSSNAEQCGAKACVVLPIPISNIPDLNTSVTPAAYLQQPFTDLQQVKLRAQILVHGSLMQNSVPDEACMISVFGPSDSGSRWESAWRACSERIHTQKTHASNLETPARSHSGSRDPDQPVKNSSSKSKTPLPAGRASSKGIPSPVVNPIIPLSSPLWNVSTPCDGLQSSGTYIDYHQPFVPLQPYQAQGLRGFVEQSPSWLSQTHFPSQWVASPQTSVLDVNARVSLIPCTEPGAGGGGAGVSSGTLSQTDVNKSAVSSGRNSANPKHKKRKRFSVSTSPGKIPLLTLDQAASVSDASNHLSEKSTAPQSVFQESLLAQNLPEMGSPVVNNVFSTSNATPTACFASTSNSGNYLAAVPPIFLSDQPTRVDQMVEKKSIVSEETLNAVEAAKLQAEDAAAHAAAAVGNCYDVWSRLSKLKNSGLRSDDETKLSSAAMAIAAAASVAKAAAAAAKLASNVAIEAKLMADEVSTTSVTEYNAQSTEISLSRASNSSPMAREGNISSSSIIAAAKETAMKRVESATAAQKHAENLDAILKAAELAAEAVSQAGKIVSIGDPLPFSELVDSDPMDYWRTPKVYPEQGAKAGIDQPETSYPEKLVPAAVNPGTVASIGKNSSRTQRGHRSSDTATIIDTAPDSYCGTNSEAVTSGDAHKTALKTSFEDGMVEGCLVEVFRGGGNCKAAWYSAKILNLKDEKAFVCYTELQADEGSEKLKEWVPLKGDSSKAPTIRIAHPTTSMCFDGTRKRRRAAVMDYTWCVGDRVDAWMQDCWLEGIVKEINKNDETTLTIYFPALGDASAMKTWHLRPTLTWQDGKWIEWPTTCRQSPSQGDTPQEKRAKLGHPVVEAAKEKDKILTDLDLLESKKHEDSGPLPLSANEKEFNIGNNKRDNKLDAQRTVRTGLQKEGSRVVFGVPKPGKKRKFMDVSKHLDSNRSSKNTNTSGSIKSATYLPQGSRGRSWNNNPNFDKKENQGAESKPKVLRYGKSQSVSGRTLPMKFNALVSAKSTEKVNEGNNSGQQDLMEFGSVSDSQDTSDGQTLVSSKGLPRVSRKRVPSSNAKSVQLSKGKLATTSGEFGKKVEQDKSFLEVAEPRRSNRKIQPTSRLLEGLQSALIISKIPSVTHEKIQRNVSKGNFKGNSKTDE